MIASSFDEIDLISCIENRVRYNVSAVEYLQQTALKEKTRIIKKSIPLI